MTVTLDDLRAASKLMKEGDPRRIFRGKAYDPNTHRWYKNGFAPWQLWGDDHRDGEARCIECGTPMLIRDATCSDCYREQTLAPPRANATVGVPPFPSNPQVGDRFLRSDTMILYEWDGMAWTMASLPGDIVNGSQASHPR